MLIKSLTCCFVFLWRSGGVLLISVQGIAVNVDPVFCTWLLYQPHRGSSRQQQQVSSPVSCSLVTLWHWFCFFYGHLILIEGNTCIMYDCRTFPTNLHPPPTKKHKNIKLPLVSLSRLPTFCIRSAPCLPSSHSLFIWQGSWWWLWTLNAVCPHYIHSCICSVWLPEI